MGYITEDIYGPGFYRGGEYVDCSLEGHRYYIYCDQCGAWNPKRVDIRIFEGFVGVLLLLTFLFWPLAIISIP